MRYVNKPIVFLFLLLITGLTGYLIYEHYYEKNSDYSINKKNTDREPINQYLKGPFKYNYSNASYDLPIYALTDINSFIEWKNNFSEIFRTMINSVTLPRIKDIQITNMSHPESANYSIYEIEMPLENGLPFGGLLAVPDMIDPKKPIIFTLHGHEEQEWGAYAYRNFREKRWMHQLAQSGYVIFAPISMYHKEVEPYSNSSSYLIVWTKLFSNSIEELNNKIFPNIPHNGLGVMGLSSGGMTGIFLMAYREDISFGVFAGSNQNLDFLRREYRIEGHPNCWDVPALLSYLPVQALIAPRPVMYQDGYKDPFFPNTEPMPGSSWFSGSTRGVLTEEFIAPILLLQYIWKLYDEDTVCLYIHEGGHEMDIGGANLFLKGDKSICY